MLQFLLFLSIIAPVIAGVIAFLDKGNAYRKQVVSTTAAVLGISALLLLFAVPDALTFGSGLASMLRLPIIALDLALLCLFLYIGWRRQHSLIIALAAVQLAGVIVLEFFMNPQITDSTPAFTIDSLAVTLVLVVSLIGSLIAWYSIGYMKEHEEHQKLEETRQPRFFATILVFLGAMNALAMADNLTWLYFFWEVTTLCSFLLIGHDDTDEARQNADRALWMNMAGGVAFVVALLYFQQAVGSLSLVEIQQYVQQSGSAGPGFLLIPLVALCFAGFTKSAQAPFQSWLCGAMVAPTPVSALLHSSTMVKAGVYLVLRLAPLFAGTAVSTLVAVCGAFTFIAMAGLAVGQSNGKKILAYSTISNLGLIIACAGINTAASIAAGIMLLIFHAVSKGLLFLCVGVIEQKIGSRNIEDMRGLFKVMPKTALITTFGILTMMLPPFGMLLAKWMALESAVEASGAMPVIVAMLALGSGLTVLFWARWAGIMLGSASPELKVPFESREPTIAKPIDYLAYAAAALSFLAPVVYVGLVGPAVQSMLASASPLLFESQYLGIGNSYGVFAVYPLYLILAGGFWYAWKETKKHGAAGALPYMSGIQASTEDGKVGFIGPMKTFVAIESGNYYLASFFGENKITRTVNTVAIALLAMLLGGVLQ
ncbi:NADH-quinone oxidoreductase subunit L [Desulfovibrio sp. OttesenSCG-928-F20]|nr:NADH-quinone oxidoreductase subunit L [Desulfovibrio sp. OttesenSCG-928-F20]